MIRELRTKLEFEDPKLKFDWLDFINQGPNLLGLILNNVRKNMNS